MEFGLTIPQPLSHFEHFGSVRLIGFEGGSPINVTALHLVLAAVVLLAGCAHGPQGVIERGIRYELVSDNAPADLALCLVRNAERIHNTLSGTYRPGEAPGMTEVLIRIPEGVIAVAHIGVAKAGSRGTLWIIGSIFESAYLHGEFTRGCCAHAAPI